MSLAVVSFGRMNPVTVGHRKLVERLVEVANERGGDAILCLSKRYDGLAHEADVEAPRVVKNPLSYKNKVKFVNDAFGSLVSVYETESNDLFQIVKEINDAGYDHVIFVGDHSFISAKFSKYNGVVYNFDSIETVLSGERADHSNDFLETVSATKVRNSVFADDYETFSSLVATKNTTQEMWNNLRTEFGFAV